MLKGTAVSLPVSKTPTVVKSQTEKDMVLFGIALSELMDVPVHAFLKTERTAKSVKFKIAHVYCHLTPEELLGINGITSINDTLNKYEGYVRLSTNNPTTFLELIDEEETLPTRTLIRNYQIAILDTYSDKVNNKMKGPKDDPVPDHHSSGFC